MVRTAASMGLSLFSVNHGLRCSRRAAVRGRGCSRGLAGSGRGPGRRRWDRVGFGGSEVFRSV
eukprot:6021076-Heterocapsa_arctica.AAC.1